MLLSTLTTDPLKKIKKPLPTDPLPLPTKAKKKLFVILLFDIQYIN